MKQIILIITLIFCATAANAQTNTYHPFPDSNAVWNFHLKDYCFGSNDYIDEQYSIIIDGDTLINNTKYNKLSTPYVLYNTTGCNGSKIATTGYKGAIREDSLNKKVYYMPPSNTTEELLYDFTLEVGDSIKGPIGSYHPIVQKIDSVLIGNSYRKRWIPDTLCHDSIYIIEGLGSTFGLIEAIARCGLDLPLYNITCFQHNQYTYYTSGNCEIITTLKNNKNLKPNFRILPNPTAGILHLKQAKNLQNISVYNLQGQKVQEIKPNKRSWELPEKSGMYLIRLQDESGNYYTEKIIKN